MNLSAEVKKYIQHKTTLANHSVHYLNNGRMLALRYANELLQLFCFQKQYLTQQDIARFILQNKQHLKEILPYEENKSYKSSLKKLNEIIEYSQQLLKPKT